MPMEDRQILFLLYNLKQKKCNEPMDSKKTCSDNPYCLHGLGIKFWLSTFNPKPLEDIISVDIPQNTVRGLKNVSTNCYCNSCIQVLFHLPQFRQAVYNVPLGQSTTPGKTEGFLDNWQFLFAQLQLGNTRVVDPERMVQCLQLPSDDQDCHEFFNWVLSHLDAEITQLSISPSHEPLSQLFRGETQPTSRCSHCGYQYSRPVDPFLQVLLRSQRPRLVECIEDYVQAEATDSKCPQANCRGQMVLCTRFCHLPQILSFLLPRLVFDPKQLRRSKCSHICYLPERLDMKPFMESSSDEVQSSHEYSLKAVFAHLGDKAHEGHYVCAIRLSPQEWILCNDDKVKRIPSTEFVMQKEFNLANKLRKAGASTDSSSSEHIPDHHASTDAYFVLYTRDDAETGPVTVPEHLHHAVKEAERLESLQRELELKNQREVQERNQRIHSAMQEICRLLIVPPHTIRNIIDSAYDSDMRLEVVPKEWLRRTLRNEHVQIPCPLNSMRAWQLMAQGSSLWPECEHSKFSLKARNYRVVRTEGVERLLALSQQLAEELHTSDVKQEVQESSENSQGRRFYLPCDLCYQCASKESDLKHFQASLEAEEKRLHKVLMQCLKSPMEECGERFWLCKKAYNSWDKRALEMFLQTRSDGPHDPVVLEAGFNRECECAHGKLRAKEQQLMAVPEEVWNAFMRFFPTDVMRVGTFPVSRHPLQNHEVREPCPDCDDHKQSLTIRAREEEGRLPSLSPAANSSVDLDLRNVEYVSPEQLNDSLSDDGSVTEFYLVPMVFVKAWRQFVKNPCAKTVPKEMDFSNELCEHKKLEGPLDLGTGGRWCLVTEAEWSTLLSIYGDQNDSMSVRIVYGGNPERCLVGLQLCNVCNSRQAAEERLVLHVRKMLGPFTGSAVLDATMLMAQEAESLVREQAPTDSRRSKRRRTELHDAIVKMQRGATLLDVKVRLMQQFCVSPVDQHIVVARHSLEQLATTLCRDNMPPDENVHLKLELSEKSATLVTLHVNNDDVLWLWVDEAQDNSDDDANRQESKAGFNLSPICKLSKFQ